MSRSKTSIRLLFCIVVALMCANAFAVDGPNRPNILFIYTDDQSHRTVSCYPEAPDWVHTPNIDALAQRGVRFTHAYIGTWCMPSRATLLTGRHQFAIESMHLEGKYPGSAYDPQKCAFWPADFRRKGYTTGQIGKWHTGNDTGFGRDWDYQAVWNRPGYVENAGKYYDHQLISFNGQKPTQVGGYSTDNYTDWAIEFIEGKHRDAARPWYLWLCYGAVHGPSIPAERHRDDYPNAQVEIPADIFPPRAGKPAYVQQVEAWIPGPDGRPVEKLKREQRAKPKTLDECVRQYQQCVSAIDEGVGRLMATLKETGQLENTLVVYTSDQGFAWGQHGFRAKLAPYDDNLRAPLIVSMAGTIPEGKVCKAPVGGADLVPTFYRFAGLDTPWTMHGRDLSSLLHEPAVQLEKPLLLSNTGERYGSDTVHVDEGEDVIRNGVPWWVFLRDNRYKYVRTLVADEIEELYDLETDPQELTNLALDPANSSRLQSLRDATIAELRRTGAGLADHLPAVSTKH